MSVVSLKSNAWTVSFLSQESAFVKVPFRIRTHFGLPQLLMNQTISVFVAYRGKDVESSREISSISQGGRDSIV